jgi:hypothetical protein
MLTATYGYMRGVPMNDPVWFALCGASGLLVALLLWGVSWLQCRDARLNWQCPRCGKHFAGLITDHAAFKVGEGTTTIPMRQAITSADGRTIGSIDTLQQFRTEVISERYDRMCKFCGHRWIQTGTREVIR